MKLRYIIFALAAAIACSAQTPTQKSRSDIYTEIDALFPDNETEEITPADLRTVAKNQAASFHNNLTDGAPAIRTANLADLQDKAAAFAAIKQAASTTVSGVRTE